MENQLTWDRLLAYQERWDAVPPPMVTLYAIAKANGFKHTPKAKAPRKMPSKPTKVAGPPDPSARAAEIHNILKMFPTGVLR